MSNKYIRICGMDYTRAFFKHSSIIAFKFLNISIVALLLSACGGSSTSGDEQLTTAAVTLEGSVGDGPITNAKIRLIDAHGAILASSVSDAAASYTITIPQGAAYPVVVEATGGTDMVTGTEPDFTMLSVAFNASANTVNINPFSTFIVKTAQSMPGGLTAGNISLATQFVSSQLNFGLDPALVSDPITTPVNEANVAAIIKASETFGELIRRTRSVMQVSGMNFSGDGIVDTIARDLTDGVIDGRGPGANVQIAATANIVAGQVLVESLINQLYVNGVDATSLMDVAINLSSPGATLTTADVIITDAMLNQARTAVVAAQAHTPSTDLSDVAVILADLSGNSLAADNASSLPVDPGSAFNEVITQLPISTDKQLEFVNTIVRSGEFQFATSAYSVGESDGFVNITINRIGGSAGEAIVEWRTWTFDGYGTADFSSDFETFLWDERPLTFADGETSKVVQISINPDSVAEDNETFTVMLRNPKSEIRFSTIVTILDDDVEPAPAPAPAPSDRPWENLLNSDDLVGFGNKTTGGKGGEVCIVTNLSSSGSNSLRDCATRSGPQWIKFDLSGTINLSSIIYPTSNKTIDGRGQDITITGEGFDTQTASNLIFHNIKISNTNSDGIRIKRGSKNIWVDHVLFSSAGDEMLSVVSASTDITVSWCKFQGSGYAILMSSSAASTADSVMRVTLHHNHFEQTGDRQPFVRHGKFHMFNNFIDGYRGSAAEARSNAQLLSENNIWTKGSTARNNLGINSSSSTYDPLPAASVVSRGEWNIDNLEFETRNEKAIFKPADWYAYAKVLDSANSALMSNIVNNSGWRSVVAPE